MISILHKVVRHVIVSGIIRPCLSPRLDSVVKKNAKPACNQQHVVLSATKPGEIIFRMQNVSTPAIATSRNVISAGPTESITRQTDRGIAIFIASCAAGRRKNFRYTSFPLVAAKVLPRRGVGEMTVGGGCGCGTSFLLHSLTRSFLKSLMAESRLDLVDTWLLLMPLSTELSRLFRTLARWLASVVVCRDHGSDLAMSAKVSLRQSLLPRPLFPEAPPPLHSRKMSVSWARLDRRRR